MRVLRLDLDNGEELDLHPYVTVLGGLAPDVHRRVADQLVRLVHGDTTGISALVEAHDVLTEVDPDTLAALGLPPDTDVVVSAEQLPGATVEAGDDAWSEPLRGRIEEARAELERLDHLWTTARDRVADATRELDEARRGLDDFAITAHDAALATLARAEGEARAAAQATDDAARPSGDDPRGRLVAELESARERESQLAAQLDVDRLHLLELLEELERERAELESVDAPANDVGADAPEDADDGASPPAPEDVEAVERALAAVREGPPPAPMVPSPEAQELAEQIAAHEQRHDALARDLRDEGIDVEDLEQQLVDARAERDAAEVAARPKVVSPEDDAEIERLHDLVVELGEKRGSRRAGKSVERSYEDASRQLGEILERNGYDTYTGYVMGRISPAVDPEARRRLEDATHRVAEIEGRLDEAAALLARDSRVLMLRAERDQLWAAARDLLGTLPDDVEGALRELQVPAEVENPALGELHQLLGRLDVEVEVADEVRLVAAAETFLADAALAEKERARVAAADAPAPASAPLGETPEVALRRRVAGLHRRATEADAALTLHEEEHRALHARVATLEAELRAADATPAAGTGLGGGDPRIDQDPRVIQAREQVAVTEARLARHQAAAARVDVLHSALGEARTAERAAHDEREVARTALDEATRQGPDPRAGGPLPDVRWELGDGSVEAIEWYLLGRVTSLRHVSHAGSVPLILDDAFRGLPDAEARSLCGVLSRIGESVQVIYLGDAPAVAEWARSQGLDHAAVVRPGEPAI